MAALSPFQVPPFVLVQAAPDSVLVGFCRVFKAVIMDSADAADQPGLCPRTAMGREEDVRVLADAQPRPCHSPSAGAIGPGIKTGSSRAVLLSVLVSSGMRDRSMKRGTGSDGPWACLTP
jgi:hypothetical protein